MQLVCSWLLSEAGPQICLSGMALGIESEWEAGPSLKAPHQPRLTVEGSRFDSAFRKCLNSRMMKAVETGQHEWWWLFSKAVYRVYICRL